MIQVTLQFTSIDKAIQALRSLPEADIVHNSVGSACTTDGSPTGRTATDKAAPSPQPPAEKTAAATKEAPAPTSPSAEAAPAAAAPAADPSTKADGPDLSGPIDGPGYKILKDAVFKLAGMSRPSIEAINKQFGVATMRDLAEDKRPAALAAINEKIAEIVELKKGA